ncbi:hypothetical protein MPSEU_000743000 [Mayamaea pseudoterrestris]|nr:hypothetical protein MPSEU_000743000 [Mayamaea pseudoterrestris]
MILKLTAIQGRSLAWILANRVVQRNVPRQTPRPQFVTAKTPYLKARFSSVSSIIDIEEDTYKELQWISSEIKRHDALYYNEGTPELDDASYDAMTLREAQICIQNPQLLERLQNESGLGITATRFGGRVGSAVADENIDSIAIPTPRFIKRKHLRKMLSLDNVHDTKQLLAWLERIRKKSLQQTTVSILTEPKLDGLSCSLRYERSEGDDTYTLQWAATRGDGTHGQDVTAAMKRITSLPLSLKASNLPAAKLEVRGEVILPNAAFASLATRETNLTFANARNAASGILLRKEDDEESGNLRSLLRFVAYDIVTELKDTHNLLSVPTLLQSIGFDIPQPVTETILEVNPDQPWDAAALSDLLDYYSALDVHRSGGQSSMQFDDYDMDGCVHKVVGSAFRNLLGSSNRAPRWAIAHKFPAQTAITSLQSIEVQVGRTGVLTPVAQLDKVQLNGVSVQRATLHNFHHMRQTLGGGDSVPRGTKVFVRRAGDVIPQVVSRVPTDESMEGLSNELLSLAPPAKCPACGSATVFDAASNNQTVAVFDKETMSSGQALRCSGPPLLCEPRAVQALQHAYSRDALNIQGLSEARIRHLMNESLLQMPSDVFTLVDDTEKLEKVEQLPGWGAKSAQALASAAKKVSFDGVDLYRFVYSLGIRGIGLHVSSLIADVYGDAEDFIRDLKGAADSAKGSSDYATFARLREENNMTKGIGPTALSALEEFAREPTLLDAATKLSASIRIHKSVPTTISSPDSGPLQGMSVVVTGSLPGLTRSEAQKLVKAMGASSTPTSISRSTDIMVRGEKAGPKKVQEAKAHNVRIMEAEELLALASQYR